MLRAVALALIVLATVPSARAEEESDAVAAMALFQEVCVATDANREAVLSRVGDGEWERVGYERLPQTDPSRQGPDRVQVIGGEPEDTIVFQRLMHGKPVFVHVFERERREGTRTVRMPACNVVIVGVSRSELALALFPDSESSRTAFSRLPLFPTEINGRRAIALEAEIASDHPLAQFGTFALFSIEGAQEEAA